MTSSYFQILERRDHGRLTLSLYGELDLVSVHELEQRMSQLGPDDVVIRLDLSKLGFIDSSGVHALVRGIQKARADGRTVEIDPVLPRQVRRVFKLVHFDATLGDERG